MRTLRLGIVLSIFALVTACSPDQDLEELISSENSGALVTSASKRYIVKFKRFKNHVPAGLADVKRRGKVHRDLTAKHYAVSVTLSAKALAKLQLNPHVDYIEVDPPRYFKAWNPPLPYLPAPSLDNQAQDAVLAPRVPYGTEMVQGDQLTGDTSANVVVCIIDSGYTPGHADLGAVNVTSSNTGAGLPWNQDGLGHGTHVAGTIRALNNTVGARGVFPGARLHIVRIFNDNGDWAYSSDLVAALDHCWNDTPADARLVVNMSLGGPTELVTERNALAAYYNDPSQRVLFIAASGNGCDGKLKNCTASHYPASYDSVVSVAAVDNTGARASFSQYAPEVEIAAPGVEVLSTVPLENSVTVGTKTYHGEWVEGGATGSSTSTTIADGGNCGTVSASWAGKVVICDYVGGTTSFSGVASVGAAAMVMVSTSFHYFIDPLGIPLMVVGPTQGATLQALDGTAASFKSQVAGSGYSLYQGTSMATPHVSGVAAKVWSVDTRWPNYLVRAALQAGAYDLNTGGWDAETGFGLVQAPATLQRLSGCIKNGFCNTICYSSGSSDPDCANYAPVYGTISGQISVNTICSPTATDPQRDCIGSVVLAVTERNIIPYNALRVTMVGTVDLSTTPTTYTVQVPVTGFPVQVWGFMFENGTPASTFISGDILSSMDQVTVTENVTLANQNVVLDQREP